ncbi:hypothetical protein H2203_004547 [Taxawa tesnikishii (nom. ined.)]|nr:hypothetical protein H2203_004547 [Dothideales sp. JES 119]
MCKQTRHTFRCGHTIQYIHEQCRDYFGRNTSHARPRHHTSPVSESEAFQAGTVVNLLNPQGPDEHAFCQKDRMNQNANIVRYTYGPCVCSWYGCLWAFGLRPHGDFGWDSTLPKPDMTIYYESGTLLPAQAARQACNAAPITGLGGWNESKPLFGPDAMLSTITTKPVPRFFARSTRRS